MLSVTGTMRSWVRKERELGAVSERAFCVITAARLPPAEEPPTAILVRLRESRVEPSFWSQRRASQESWTAAGKGFSGASLDYSLIFQFCGWGYGNLGSRHL